MAKDSRKQSALKAEDQSRNKKKQQRRYLNEERKTMKRHAQEL